MIKTLFIIIVVGIMSLLSSILLYETMIMIYNIYKKKSDYHYSLNEKSLMDKLLER